MTSNDVQMNLNQEPIKASLNNGNLHRKSSRNFHRLKTIFNADTNSIINQANKQKENNHIKERENGMNLSLENNSNHKNNNSISTKNMITLTRKNSLINTEDINDMLKKELDNDSNQNGKLISQSSLRQYKKSTSQINIKESVANINSDDNQTSEDNKVPEKGITLDKLFGGNFKVINVFNNGNDPSEDIFPKNPRDKNKQKNFDILEADEEDELLESVKVAEMAEYTDTKIPYIRKSLRNSASVEYFDNSNNIGLDKNKGHIDMTHSDKIKHQELINSSYNPSPTIRKNIKKMNSQSPAEKSENCLSDRKYSSNSRRKSFSPLKSFRNQSLNHRGYKTNSIPGTLVPILSHTKADFKKDKIVDFYKTQANFNKNQDKDILMHDDDKQNETIINKILHDHQRFKENKFFNQKRIIEAKFKNEDEMLISKYANKFHLYESPSDIKSSGNQFASTHNLTQKYSTNNSNVKLFSKRISTPANDTKPENTIKPRRRRYKIPKS